MQPACTNKPTDTSSREYVEWMASVWKANMERNQK